MNAESLIVKVENRVSGAPSSVGKSAALGCTAGIGAVTSTLREHEGRLIGPQWIAGTRAALARHDVTARATPYTVDALGWLVRMAVQRLSS
ncbi:hypothetical protein AWB76_04866 [Caballeronia temeraria]|uniref:Uncharacterized protein n=1 Tax=Caballeronia temeraria TaxID=1777137 RepID=A0A158BYK4_9BURK|nr:hypothetical protein AWB76_04866 [Caballeronia temeraria]